MSMHTHTLHLSGLLPVENVADLFTDVCPQSEEFAVDPVQGGLEEVSLARILAVKQTQQLFSC